MLVVVGEDERIGMSQYHVKGSERKKALAVCTWQDRCSLSFSNGPEKELIVQRHIFLPWMAAPTVGQAIFMAEVFVVYWFGHEGLAMLQGMGIPRFWRHPGLT
jgi:hypothetical protein